MISDILKARTLDALNKAASGVVKFKRLAGDDARRRMINNFGIRAKYELDGGHLGPAVFFSLDDAKSFAAGVHDSSKYLSAQRRKHGRDVISIEIDERDIERFRAFKSRFSGNSEAFAALLDFAEAKNDGRRD